MAVRGSRTRVDSQRRERHARWFAAIAAVVVVMWIQLDAQHAVYRSGIDMVPLTVTVTDAVLEDGVPQTVSFFASDEVPVDVALVMDTSSSMAPVMAMLQSAARGLVRGLHDGDRATIVDVKKSISLTQPLSEDLANVARAIDQLRPSGATAMYDGVYIALQQFQRDRRHRPSVRRQVLVVFSDGLDNASHVTADAMADLARRVDVTIYTVALGQQTQLAAALDSEKPALWQAAYTMRALASDAGGRTFLAATAAELPAIYEAIRQELASQYQVGYIPQRPFGDNRFRNVSVRVLRPTSAIARTRSGYIAGS
jgi:Ca-activated chloride channel homolog